MIVKKFIHDLIKLLLLGVPENSKKYRSTIVNIYFFVMIYYNKTYLQVYKSQFSKKYFQENNSVLTDLDKKIMY